ncbi:MAG TPA: type II toxin-antitoxin system VapC family toxin [Solirubrobacteraceae bacterium]|nr:type II toxin-antitoxin system VapC family toxin [Solirubrobacteraceae bacterium]
MILDSSAVVAILLREPDHERLLERLAQAEMAAIGAPTLTECGIVLSARLGAQGKTLLARFVEEAALTAIPFTAEHHSAALDAYLRYGKGRHAAALNFGDCMTYATARLAGAPLLCIGEDFARTDLPLAE